ncbi:MAG: MFS transporter [Clostridia bacterium]|nr:MFS transporter [Clostridia bacterium]
METTKKSKFHYGFVIVLGGFIIMALLHSMLQTCFSLFLVPVTEGMGVTRTQFSLCTSVVAIVTMFVSPKMGKLLGKKNTRTIFTLCVAGMGLSYATYSFATEIWHMYISAALVGAFSCGAVVMPVSIIISNWFEKGRGTAMSIALAGSGLGGTVITPILNNLIASQGYSRAFLIFGILMVVIEVPIAFFVMRPSPADMGLEPFGHNSVDKASSGKKKETVEVNVTLAELKKQPFFYIYLLGIFAMCVCGYGSLGQLSAALTDSYGATFSAAIVSFFLLVLTPAKISLGWIYDKFGSKIGTIYVMAVYGIAFLLLAFVTDNPMVMYAMAVCFSIGISSGTVSPSVVTAATFGSKDYGAIFGFVNFFSMAAMVVGSPAIAAVYDFAGSYKFAWITCFVLSILSIICLVYADMRCKKVFADRIEVK